MPRQFVTLIAERIRHAVSVQLFDIGGDQRIPVSCSVGLAEYPLFRDAQQQLGWEQMVELADAALYLVKQNGRNGWAILRPSQKAELSTLIRGLQTGTQTLIDNGRLELTSSFSEQKETV